MALKLPEARDRAALVSDVHTTVHLDLRSTEEYTVDATVRFSCAEPGASTFLELDGARDVTLDGQPAPYADGRIALDGLAASNEVRVTATLPYVTDGDGMTVTVDPADGERYVCAFTAMDIAHKVIPCFDQPDLKTTFTVSVTGPAHWTVLANGLAISQEREGEDGGARRFSFAPTPPISTYLFFVAAGPWVSETWEEPYEHAESGALPFGWHARASQERELRRDAAELRRITSTCFRWFTEAFDPPYAFDDYQQVFTPGLNWGAMEFPGCVAFRDQYLVQGAPTALQRQWLANTIAHEMAHMWFGDLVTMEWWQDTWLNESFADYMGYEVAALAAGYDDAWTTAALTRKPTGYRADLRRSTHRIAEDAEQLIDADTAFANFDMITYAKGNAVLRQLGTWLGEDFLAGVNRHLRSHAFGNATLADFLDALDAETDRDVRGWAEKWLRTTGFDTIEVTRRDWVPVLTRHGSRPHRFTVSAYDDHLRLVETRTVDLDDEPLVLEGLAGRVVVPNAGDETFVALRLDDHSWEVVTRHLSAMESSLTRAVLWWAVIDRVESHGSSLADLSALLGRHLRVERDPVIFESVLAAALRIARLYAAPEDLPAFFRSVEEVCHAALAEDEPALEPAALRALAGTTRDRDLLVRWLHGTALDQEVRWIAVRRLAELGDPSFIAAEEERDRSVSGHLAALAAHAAVPTPEAKAEAWARLMGGGLGNHELTAAAAGFWGWEQADLVAPYLDRYLVEGLALATASGQAMSQIIGRAFPYLPMTGAARQQLRDRLAEVLDGEVPTVLARTWNDALDDLDRALTGR
ncbi:aminopeptidase N [Nocardioides sp. GY 10113]|uniref:aminopeptidase N n=1 Tax=Nocardioides sp. GY 10113 TaxID=2569761 RepID=UPI0010A8A57E|nr:aminopeptidase N [Nocardioides sp. GY 10113]TIC88465.1 aminopeptidase N [Nocardioides sp. GY 10113]